jgi:uncharacterized protein DUF6852/uncharacterized protein DUF5606
MDLKGIVGIKGKSGLFKIISGDKARVIIVESFEDKKRFPATDPYGISQLDTVTVYANDGQINIVDIFQNMLDKESEHPVPDSKVDQKILKDYFKIVAPDYDEDKVYGSDIKKIVSWFHILKEKHYFDVTENKPEPTENTEPQE